MEAFSGGTAGFPFSREQVKLLQTGITRLRGNQTEKPEASIIIPVNAQIDLENFYFLLKDLVKYQGNHRFEVIAVINNYAEHAPPLEIMYLKQLGATVIDIPNAKRPGETVSFSARVPAVQAASSENTIHFDADCRVRNVTAVLDTYVDRLNDGCALVYSPVEYFGISDELVMKVRVSIHHAARSFKRNILKIPTPRGSNYAVNRTIFLQLYKTGKLRDDIQLGPNIKAIGAKHQYCCSDETVVLTSGRRIRKGWLKIIRYIYRRSIFNIRYIFDTGAAQVVKKQM